MLGYKIFTVQVAPREEGGRKWKKGRKEEAQGSTTTVGGSDREFVVVVARIAKEEKLPNNGLDGGAIGVKPRQNGDDHDRRRRPCVCVVHLKSGRNRVTRSQLLS